MSEEKTFNDPKLAITKVYTKTGDKGTTSLVGGQRVPKNDHRIDAYGTVDELNAFVGMAVQELRDEGGSDEGISWLVDVLVRVQHELFNLGAILATLPADVHPKQPQIREADVVALEVDMDRCNEALPPLRSFVLPGGSRANTTLHVCRTVARRAERMLVSLVHDGAVPNLTMTYLNRLSDAFFVWSRWVNLQLYRDEVMWQPNCAASAQ